jgi:hypothetical protein
MNYQMYRKKFVFPGLAPQQLQHILMMRADTGIQKSL